MIIIYVPKKNYFCSVRSQHVATLLMHAYSNLEVEELEMFIVTLLVLWKERNNFVRGQSVKDGEKVLDFVGY